MTRTVNCKAAHHAPHNHTETSFCIEPVALPAGELPPRELVVLVWVGSVRHQVTVTEAPDGQLLCTTDGVQSFYVTSMFEITPVLRRALADQS